MTVAEEYDKWTNTYDVVSNKTRDLEHIQNLDFIFSEAVNKLISGGKYYICEIHPFKQYTGTKASYESGNNKKSN